jgi:hypothetical protein
MKAREIVLLILLIFTMYLTVSLLTTYRAMEKKPFKAVPTDML